MGKALGISLSILLVVAACSSGSASETVDRSTATTTAPSLPSPTTTADSGEAAQETSASDVLAQAVDDLLDAGSYAFKATILLTLGNEPAEIELEGWVDGSDRELVMKSGGQKVTTRVIDGLATVQRDSQITEVALEDAGDSPSVLILKTIQNPEFVSQTQITGTLDASQLEDSGFDANASAIVNVTLTSDLKLAGYSIATDNGIWTVEARFFRISQTS